WLERHTCAEIGAIVRRIDGDELASRGLPFATAYLRGRPDATRLVVRLRGGPAAASEVEGGIRLRSPERGDEVLLARRFTVPASTWTDVEAPLARAPAEGEELAIDLQGVAGTVLTLRRIALEP